MAMRVLILAGTAQATALAGALAGDPRFQATASLAGRTARPAPLPLPTRIGGFGGVAGLAAWLREAGVAAVVDATHPFAARISAHAEQACRATGVPLAVLGRPAWEAGPGDDWRPVDDMEAAAARLADWRGCVFLTIGRQELAPFAALAAARPDLPFLVRTVDPPEALPSGATLILDRGPYTVDGELDLMRRHAVSVVVSKNSGGTATAAKLAAARVLGLPVVMVRRPPPGTAPVFTEGAAVVDWLARVAATGHD